jgi:hypothetical protein
VNYWWNAASSAQTLLSFGLHSPGFGRFPSSEGHRCICSLFARISSSGAQLSSEPIIIFGQSLAERQYLC